MSAMVRVENLVKSYGDNRVLKGVSLEVQQGEVFALLGMNGAGKTTTMECIEGLRRPDGGTVELAGSLGVQLQSSNIMPECKVKEAVELFCLWNRADPRRTLRLFGIEQLKNKAYGSLSVGQKKKLHLALALIGDPDIVILDEPTAGLDVESRVLLHSEIKALKEAGTTFLLASHDMAEVEELCDTIAILRDGRIAFCGKPSELKDRVGQQVTIGVKASGDTSHLTLQSCTYVGSENDYDRFRADDLGAALLELASACRTAGIELIDVQTDQANLEQRFLRLSKGDAA